MYKGISAKNWEENTLVVWVPTQRDLISASILVKLIKVFLAGRKMQMLTKSMHPTANSTNTSEHIWLILQAGSTYTGAHVYTHIDKCVIHSVPVTLTLHMVKTRAEKISTQLCGWLQLGSQQSPEVRGVEATQRWLLQPSFPYRCACPLSYTVACINMVVGGRNKKRQFFFFRLQISTSLKQICTVVSKANV